MSALLQVEITKEKMDVDSMRMTFHVYHQTA